MKCFQCGKGKMTSKLVGVTASVRREEIPVQAEAMVCDHCGFQVLSDEQSDAYTVASADAYRERHGLLTSSELKEIRNRLEMSQQAFASYLKAGVASVKRWESGLVQDEAMDQLIRLKGDLKAARENVTQLERRLEAQPSASRVQVIVVPAPQREACSKWDARRVPFHRPGHSAGRFWKHSADRLIGA